VSGAVAALVPLGDVHAHGAGHAPARPAPLRLGPCVRYSKSDAFEICGALALAESVLRVLGHADDAALVGAVFEVAEAGLARSHDRPSAVGPGGCDCQLPGSNSIARELTQ
jgi:hypothetical protein